VQDGWEKAVETVLGDYLQAVCVEDIEPLTESISNLKAGRLTVLQAGGTAGTGDTHFLAAKVQGAIESSEHWRSEKALPLPAQFFQESSRLAALTGVKVQYRLISLHPINKLSGPTNEFEKKALEAIMADPDRPYRGFVTEGGERRFQALYADNAVSPVCVTCHNAHPPGGVSTLRGFSFRGASPVSPGTDVIVGGQFSFLGSVEYMFPLTADDMVKAVVFCDFGTVEEKIEINAEDYRVAPGAGLRIFIPAMGPAPIALDFAFPVAKEDTDDTQIFSFFIGFGR
jgi:hypothetical protein